MSIRPSRAMMPALALATMAAAAPLPTKSAPIAQDDTVRLGGWRHRPGSSKLSRAQKKKKRKIAAASKRRNRR